jgi:hypothetical protein
MKRIEKILKYSEIVLKLNRFYRINLKKRDAIRRQQQKMKEI